jgi:hypothetical protein
MTSDKKTVGPASDSTTPFFTKTSQSKLLISKKESNNSEIPKPVSQNSVESENTFFLKEKISSNSSDNIASSTNNMFLSNGQKDNKKLNFNANFRNDISQQESPLVLNEGVKEKNVYDSESVESVIRNSSQSFRSFFKKSLENSRNSTQSNSFDFIKEPNSFGTRNNGEGSKGRVENEYVSGFSNPVNLKSNATPQRMQKRGSSTEWFKNKDVGKQQVVSITYEEIGLFPRSFNRVFDRFFKQLFFDVENLVVQEYRFYRYLFLTTVKCLFILIFIPFLVNFISKNYLVRPITEYYWNSKQPEIFLNSYMQKKAFNEFKNFEEKVYFESLTLSDEPSFLLSLENELSVHSVTTEPAKLSGVLEKNPIPLELKVPKSSIPIVENVQFQKELIHKADGYPNSLTKVYETVDENKKQLTIEPLLNTEPQVFQLSTKVNPTYRTITEIDNTKPEVVLSDHSDKYNLEKTVNYENLLNKYVQKRLQNKTLELAIHYNEESIEAITNFLADILSFTTLCFLLLNFEIQINITKSFLLEVFFGLDDSKKSLFILFVTDLLVGYHSPNIWELFFSSIFEHYGLPENETTIFLMVATLPVLLDVLFKYLIFRHLNRASPATVATYHAMIE